MIHNADRFKIVVRYVYKKLFSFFYSLYACFGLKVCKKFHPTSGSGPSRPNRCTLVGIRCKYTAFTFTAFFRLELLKREREIDGCFLLTAEIDIFPDFLHTYVTCTPPLCQLAGANRPAYLRFPPLLTNILLIQPLCMVYAEIASSRLLLYF